MKPKTLSLCITATVMIFILALSGNACASEGRRIIDSLYSSPGRLPINDLVADLEVFEPLQKQTGSGESALTLASKDKVIFKKPNKLKLDIIINDPGGALDKRQMTIIRDGTHCWLYVSAGQYPVKKQPDEPSPTLNLPPNIQVYPHQASNQYSVVGKETISKIPTTIVKIVDGATDEVTKIWVDTEKMVPVKMEKTMPDPKGKGDPTVKVVNYREFKQLKDGRWFPFVLEIATDDKTDRVVVYKAISVNVGIEDHIFEPMQQFIK